MKLSAPIHVLKMQARELKKEKSITMVEALNSIAIREGFNSWSLLQSKSSELLPNSFNEVYDYLNPGDLVLVGARPGMRKTTFCIGLFVKAIQINLAKNFFFSLSEVHKGIARRIARFDESIGESTGRFELDYSNDISADYIISKFGAEISTNSFIVIDYLQLLDQKRINDTLHNQVKKLKEFAKEKGCIIVFISQINREIEYQVDQRPQIKDILLPNPIDLSLINKVIFLYINQTSLKESEIIFAKPKPHVFKYQLVNGDISFK